MMSEHLDPVTGQLPLSRARLSRRGALGLVGTSALMLGIGGLPLAAKEQEGDATDVLSEGAVLRDPEIPVAGNPDGDVTIVEFFDFQCPSCRQLVPDLRDAVKQDGGVRLIYKDWPILGAVSVYAARIVVAARFQDKFIPAHDALIAADRRLTEGSIQDRLKNAGVDVARAVADMASQKPLIDALLKRNDDQASAFGFNGTPSFIIGKFRVPGALKKEHFALAIADARKANARK